MTELDLVKEWFRFSHNDLLVAKQCLEKMRPKQTEIACYHCQQSAEKALKGFLLFHKTEPQKTHNLRILCQMCIQKDVAFTAMLNCCSDLTSFSATTRYPEELAPNDEIAATAISDAQKVYNFCVSKIGL
jgi:HEPN domain-containing protein